MIDSQRFLIVVVILFFFFFSSRRRHTRSDRDWSSDVCSSDLELSKVTGGLMTEATTPDGVIRVQTYTRLPRRDRCIDSCSASSGRSSPATEIGRASCRERV